MSYFRPQCERSRKKGNNTSEQQELQVPYTDEKHLTEQGAMCAHMSLCRSGYACFVCE